MWEQCQQKVIFINCKSCNSLLFPSFFSILPVLGFKEKTIPVPLSITEPVLGGSPNLAMAKNKRKNNLDK